MHDAADLIYLYDGSMEGFLCCVYESVYSHTIPVDILSEDAAQPTLFRQQYIETDNEKAGRVWASIPKRISSEAAQLVWCVFLSCMPGKELAILRFLLLGYRQGRQVTYLVSHKIVQPLLAARQNLLNEAHLLKEFVRFSDYDGVLAATITPKNFVLPFMTEHFCSRFRNENFLIFDRTHHAAVVYENKQARLISLDDLELPPATVEEQRFRILWKQFYNTIAIEARINPSCRMTHCPRRYWANMLEMEEALCGTPDGFDAQAAWDALNAAGSAQKMRDSLKPANDTQTARNAVKLGNDTQAARITVKSVSEARQARDAENPAGAASQARNAPKPANDAHGARWLQRKKSLPDVSDTRGALWLERQNDPPPADPTRGGFSERSMENHLRKAAQG